MSDHDTLVKTIVTIACALVVLWLAISEVRIRREERAEAERFAAECRERGLPIPRPRGERP